eukprot:1046953-Rhodomonas_salina.1
MGYGALEVSVALCHEGVEVCARLVGVVVDNGATVVDVEGCFALFHDPAVCGDGGSLVGLLLWSLVIIDEGVGETALEQDLVAGALVW